MNYIVSSVIIFLTILALFAIYYLYAASIITKAFERMSTALRRNILEIPSHSPEDVSHLQQNAVDIVIARDHD